jgi:hypothetical protein
MQQSSGTGLRVIRFRDAHAALGRAVVQLMGKPGFAGLRFGFWSRVLVGQINRGHCLFVARGDGETLRIVGFAGWMRGDQQQAEAFLAGGDPPELARNREGDCLIVNAWQADDAAAQAFLRAELRQRSAGVRMVYGRRLYADGRNRSVRLAVRHAAAVN